MARFPDDGVRDEGSHGSLGWWSGLPVACAVETHRALDGSQIRIQLWPVQPRRVGVLDERRAQLPDAVTRAVLQPGERPALRWLAVRADALNRSTQGGKVVPVADEPAINHANTLLACLADGPAVSSHVLYLRS